MEIKTTEQAKNEDWDVCVYGLGYLGKRLYNDIPEIFGLRARYYCDGDNAKVMSVNLPGIIGIYKETLLKTKSPTIVFILVDDPYDIEIQEMLSLNHNLYTITLREMVQMENVIRLFYGDNLFAKFLRLPNYRYDRG